MARHLRVAALALRRPACARLLLLPIALELLDPRAQFFA
jgi:hypothetical protein